jgi:SAM-dependent methyltransferase
MKAGGANSGERLCPICSDSRPKHFADELIDHRNIDDFTYASRKCPEFMCLRLGRCPTCDLVYAPTPPPPDFLLAAYSAAAFDSGTEARLAARTYAKALTPHLARFPLRHAAVDVGAGSGPLLPWLAAAGFSPVIGIEPSQSAIEAAPAETRDMLRMGMFSPDLLADVTPSLICSFMTLEHLASPGEFARQAYDLLEPGGMLAVIVHNWRAPLNRLLGMRSPIIDVEHLQLFSPSSLRRLLVEAGFGRVRLESIKNTYPLRYWLRLTPFPRGLKDNLGKLMNLLKLGELLVSLRVGNLLALGEKP